MDKHRIHYLFKQYISETCTAAELEEFRLVLANAMHDEKLMQLMDEVWVELETAELKDLGPGRAAFLFNDVVNQSKKQVRIRPLWLQLAAAMLLLLTLGTVLFYMRNGAGETFAYVDPVVVDDTIDVEPGSNKAVLTLADGRAIDLSSEQRGITVANNDITYPDGTIVSDVRTQSSSLMSLTTPRGGQYQIVLADGTRVWLNSASKLVYPAAFTGTKREVSLIGEGYFEVANAKDQPFIVQSGDQQIEVLGTQFNISAYQDDATIKTTLVDGSVRLIKQPEPGKADLGPSVILKPGQQAVTKPGSARVELSNVNALEALAWKDGLFIFNNEDIKSMMTRLSRWYDMEVVYEGDVNNIKFQGNYSRHKNLKSLLKSIELTGMVRFKIEDSKHKTKRVVIMSM